MHLASRSLSHRARLPLAPDFVIRWYDRRDFVMGTIAGPHTSKATRARRRDCKFSPRIVDSLPFGAVQVIRAPEGKPSSFPGRKALAALERRASESRIPGAGPVKGCPAPAKVPMTRQDIPAHPDRPLPIVLPWIVDSKARAVGALWEGAIVDHAGGMRTGWSATLDRDLTAQEKRYGLKIISRPLPRVLEWREETGHLDYSPAWDYARPATTIARYDGGELRLQAGPDADALIARMASSVTPYAPPVADRVEPPRVRACRACTGPTEPGTVMCAPCHADMLLSMIPAHPGCLLCEIMGRACSDPHTPPVARTGAPIAPVARPYPPRADWFRDRIIARHLPHMARVQIRRAA